MLKQVHQLQGGEKLCSFFPRSARYVLSVCLSKDFPTVQLRLYNRSFDDVRIWRWSRGRQNFRVLINVVVNT